MIEVLHGAYSGVRAIRRGRRSRPRRQRGHRVRGVTRLGAVPVVRRHDIAYHRAETVGDRLEVSTVIEQGNGVRWLRRNDLRRGSELLAHAATGWVWIDPETRRPKRLPSAIENAFGQVRNGWIGVLL